MLPVDDAMGGPAVRLRFRVENHGSFRDSAELSLVSAAMRGAVPADRNWLKATTRVGGIYGANASGKSTLLDAIEFLCDAVRYSATRWGDREKFPYQPFLLDEVSADKPSSYEIDFVLDDIRYNYGFVSDAGGVHEEWLYSYHTNRRTMLFERNGARQADYSFGRTLAGESVTISRLVRPTALSFCPLPRTIFIQSWLACRVIFLGVSTMLGIQNTKGF